jgi:hypothetical protein
MFGKSASSATALGPGTLWLLTSHFGVSHLPGLRAEGKHLLAGSEIRSYDIEQERKALEVVCEPGKGHGEQKEILSGHQWKLREPQ